MFKNVNSIGSILKRSPIRVLRTIIGYDYLFKTLSDNHWSVIKKITLYIWHQINAYIRLSWIIIIHCKSNTLITLHYIYNVGTKRLIVTIIPRIIPLYSHFNTNNIIYLPSRKYHIMVLLYIYIYYIMYVHVVLSYQY